MLGPAKTCLLLNALQETSKLNECYRWAEPPAMSLAFHTRSSHLESTILRALGLCQSKSVEKRRSRQQLKVEDL